MRYTRIGVVLTVLSLISSVAAPRLVAQQREAEVLLQRAMHTEQVEGDLERAIELYGQLLADHANVRPVAARALLRLGLCYENLGREEAANAYERLLGDYADQADFVAQARARLAALRTPATAGRGPVARRVASVADIPEDAYALAPSPDGRRVAYISRSDGGVYARDVASGEVQEVASGRPAVWNYFPIWSPDGRRLAFAEENEETGAMSVKIIDLVSREAVVVPGTEVEGWIDVEDWSRDGRYLLCNLSPQPFSALALIAVDDGTMTVLADSVYQGTGSLSPDGRFVAYAVGEEENAHVFVQPVAGGARRQITSAPGGNYRPHWAPDGRAIAYQHPSGIWLVPMTDGAPTGEARLAVSAANFMLRRWTEAGLYYAQSAGGQRMAPYQIPMDPATGRPGAGRVQNLPGDHPESVWGFAWSPDMQRVAFGHPGSPEITIYSADPRTVVTYDLGRQGHAHSPRWSEDGQEVLYEPRGVGTTVVALDMVTGRVRELFPPIMNVGGFSLSADGRLMVFNRHEGTGPARRIGAVVVAETGQSDGRVVATADGPGEAPLGGGMRPRLSPRGDQVLFGRKAATEELRQLSPRAASLWVVGSDGTGARRLATAAIIQNAVWDPTGRFIAFSGKPDMADGSTAVIRVVEVATGVETDIPLPGYFTRNLGIGDFVRMADWSSDGRLLGIVVFKDAGWESWVVQGLVEGGR